MNEELSILDRFGGTHLLWTFVIFAAAGFAVVYLDQYVFTKIEAAVGMTPTVV
jgi:hypothetical protein